MRKAEVGIRKGEKGNEERRREGDGVLGSGFKGSVKGSHPLTLNRER